MKDRNKRIKLSAFLLYTILGASSLFVFFVLTNPNSQPLKNSENLTVVNVQVPDRTTTEQSATIEIKEVAMPVQTDSSVSDNLVTNKPKCYIWENLSTEQSEKSELLLADNPSIFNFLISKNNRFTLFIIPPKDKKTLDAISNILLNKGVILSKDTVTMNNGEKAWPINSFEDEHLSIQVRDSLARNNPTLSFATERSSDKYNVTFNTENLAIITMLNSFSNRNKFPLIKQRCL